MVSFINTQSDYFEQDVTTLQQLQEFYLYFNILIFCSTAFLEFYYLVHRLNNCR